MLQPICLRVGIVLIAWNASSLARSEEVTRPSASNLEFFEKKVRPLLASHCYECHSRNAKKLGGGLFLDTRDGIRSGGDSGRAIEPGKPDQSLLIRAVRYAEDSVQMPPKGKLSPGLIADLEEWVRLGAPDPRDDNPGTNQDSGGRTQTWSEVFRERSQWWSLRALQVAEVPEVVEERWSRNSIDRFVRRRLQDRGLAPAEPASRRNVLRRLYLVLTGLPPTAEEVHEFELAAGLPAPHVDSAERTLVGESASETAFEQLVDKVLSSAKFGERWARHWMDVVRFTETHGNEWNYEVHHAWRYRDYLIRAFNADVSYDQFVFEHIAGDLMPQPRWNMTERCNESVIGTGFYRFGEVNHDDCISLREIGFDLIDNQIDTLTKAFQATTVACARCHDHKFDAVSMRDYYGMLGILKSSRLVAHTIDAPEVNATVIARLRDAKKPMRDELVRIWKNDRTHMARLMRAAAARAFRPEEADSLSEGLNAAALEKWAKVLRLNKQPMEDPFEPLRRTLQGATWEQVTQQYVTETSDRDSFNGSRFTTFVDFRSKLPASWQFVGQGFTGHPTQSGDLVVSTSGDQAVGKVLPSGVFTHAISDKLNGALRSPVIPTGFKNISFEVSGQRSSALRLVSNNCQLNYKNYRALINSDLHWITFSPPDDRDHLQTYAELMTMFDNPKFPDQLSALGGDNANYRLPWDKAAENPRSYFGITRVVLHDCAETPKGSLSHLRSLFGRAERMSLEDVIQAYVSTISDVICRWETDQATSDDTVWLNALIGSDLLTNEKAASPLLGSLVDEYRVIESSLSLPRVSVGVGDHDSGYDHPLFIRGDCQRPGEVVPRRFVEVLTAERDRELPHSARVSTGSGRLSLARHIANPKNPLTARVFVNRVWHHLFGTGIVRSVDDFGHLGELPSHPELLDHLALEFIEHDWSIKWLIRSIVLSQTFRTSATASPQAKELDPTNLLLQHYPARRLEAEAIRDSILQTAGSLRARIGGPSVFPWRDKEYADRRLFPGPVDGDGRRSIYIKNNLMEPPKFLSAFDFPGGKVAQGRRDVTNVPAQALALLNDPFVIQQADHWAQKIVRDLGREEFVNGKQLGCLNEGDDRGATRPISPITPSFDRGLDMLFAQGLQRAPTDHERRRFAETAGELCRVHQINPAELATSGEIWRELAHAVFNLQEFIYIP